MAFPSTVSFPSTGTFPASASFPAGSSFPSAYDPDAVNYFTASGVTDPTQRLNISQFITGIKGLSLWTQLTEGWTFRSTQNAGSGTTAFGLKGAFNGTLVNTPTWTATGLTFATGAARYVSTTILLNYSTYNTDIGFFNASNIASSPLSTYGDGSSGSLYVERSNSTTLATIRLGVVGATFAFATVANYEFAFAYVAGSVQGSITMAGNGGNFGATTTPAPNAAPNNTALRIGAIGSSNTVGATQSCYLKFARILTNSEHAAVYSLYKLTIGQGLGLP